MDCLTRFFTPQLERLHRGKVRDSYRVDAGRRLIVVTDRISAFDKVLETPVPFKGAVLNGLSNFWFEQTRDVIDNHLVQAVDPQANLVREAKPLRIEMVVRGYITGSMWRGYEKGKRTISGLKVEDGLRKNQRLPAPLLTPTTKEESDREISREEIVSQGWVEEKVYAQMEKAALALFKRGTELLAKKGLLLVDTKYEFGLVDGKLVLIDEIHTPDSSRFWAADDYQRDPKNVVEMDKEYVRRWLMEHTVEGQMPMTLPPEVVAEASRRYLALYERVTGQPLQVASDDVRGRLCDSLVRAGLIKDGYVAVVMGSPKDVAHGRKLQEALAAYGVAAQLRVGSAHKNGDDVVRMAEEYNESIEPGAVIAVAGLSNGLGGALAASLNVPVINCPPFKDQTDLQLNLASSLMMPSRVPAATVVGAENAAHAALRALNLRRLRERFAAEIAEGRRSLREEDQKLRAEAYAARGER